MIDRRRFVAAGAAVAGAVAAGVASVAPPALAQSASGTESAWARINRTKVLRMGAVPGQAPYYIKDPASGEWQGFMIDFGRDLAATLGAKLEIQETTWGNAVLDLEANKIDLFFGLNPTPQRALVVDFSEPLFNNAFVLLARKDFSATTWESLNKPDFKVAVDQGSSHDQMITRTCPNATIIRLESAPTATLALQSGRADAQVLVIILALPVLKKNPSIGHIVVPAPVQNTTTNIGFRKEDDKTWQSYVNKWIATERASGKVKDVVMGNLERLVGVKPDEIPAGISF
jgi:polar amino acid transport system substrate-binding protein